MPAPQVPYSLAPRTLAQQLERAAALHSEFSARRSCRAFSPREVPRNLIERILEIAHTAPSGANLRPWRFVAIDDPRIKREIRIAAEKEERESYERRMPQEWLDALEPIGTDCRKPFLDVAPWLIVVFRIDWEPVGDKRRKNYYPNESTGLACGLLIAAAHMLGLATLTHTPSPMGFLREICGRPDNEKPFLLIPVGYPAEDCTVPDLPRIPLAQRVQWNREAPLPDAR
ncbi:MAG: nitroreductase family protein [Planctomycetia bacterium]|nr:MAG: nitroreductase family protein [Planctomycetia bacterium]